MIPKNFIESWKTDAKWQTLAMMEQDMVISRALVALYNHPDIANSLVFRGGTALNKLFIKPPSRYSEDIDFVQRRAEPVGKIIDIIRDLLKDWLGEPKRKVSRNSLKLIYSYRSATESPAKLKIEINTVEHINVLPLINKEFSISSEWFTGKADICTYALDELIATKLRALYQRKKGRDLFDLWFFGKQKFIDNKRTINIFKKYCEHCDAKVSKKLFQQNIELKRLDKDFQADVDALLSHDKNWNFEEAIEFVKANFIDEL